MAYTNCDLVLSVKEAADLQPGQKIIVNVQRARKS